ncbi:hypothetical protein HYW75_03345 [Candidatus Pacearchaeota archaeon]|nr:hypothetical protein [Candidatus Pacearchaeota archaeon]
MPSEKITLAFEGPFYNKIKQKAKKQGFRNVRDYIYDVLQHRVYYQKRLGRGTKMSYDEMVMNKIAKPTSESRKRIAWAKKVGLWQ